MEAAQRELEIVNKLAERYVSYRKRFTMIMSGSNFFIPKKKGIAVPLSDGILMAHVRREYAVGVFAGRYASKFMCFDIDVPDPHVIRGILHELSDLGIPMDMLHVSTSGGKGFHIDLFFDELVFTADLWRVFYHLQSRINMANVEFRPTHNQSIKLPLSTHPKTGNVCWYLDRSTLSTIEDQAYILGIKPFSGKRITEIAQSIVVPDTCLSTKGGHAGSRVLDLLDDSLPRDRIVMAGTRHALMVH